MRKSLVLFANVRQVLSHFDQAYPAVQLEVTCDLTLNLVARFRHGDFDLVLVKREPERSDHVVRVWREPPVWVAAERLAVPREGPLPLVLSPPPCVYRKRATDSLNAARRLKLRLLGRPACRRKSRARHDRAG